METTPDPKKFFVNPEQVSAFFKFRPYYGDDLYQHIINRYHKPRGDHSNMMLALDLGCGTGQSTVPLARFFQKVYGVDISPVMIAKAPKSIHNVSFVVGNAEALGNIVQSHKVDVVTIGQAFHWLNKDKLFPEVKRVLKPGGTLAVYNYEGRHMVEPEAEKIMREFESHLDEYRKKTVDHVDESYDPAYFPFDDVQRVDNFPMERDYTPNALHGYLRSLSYYQMYLNDHPTSSILEDLMRSMDPLFTTPEGNSRRLKMKWKFTLVLGRNNGT